MHKRLAATNLVSQRLHWSLQSGLIFIADWFPTVRRSACQEKGGDFLKHSGDLSVSDEGMNNWHFIDDQLQIGDGFAICHRPVCVLHHFVTSIHINDSSFYCLIISTIVLIRRVVSLSKTLYSPKVLVNYPGSDGSVPTWLKNCWLGR